jgi:hypothetical protein
MALASQPTGVATISSCNISGYTTIVNNSTVFADLDGDNDVDLVDLSYHAERSKASGFRLGFCLVAKIRCLLWMPVKNNECVARSQKRKIVVLI